MEDSQYDPDHQHTPHTGLQQRAPVGLFFLVFAQLSQFGKRLPGIFLPTDTHQDFTGFGRLPRHSQPTRAFGNHKGEDKEHACRNQLRPEHPTPGPLDTFRAQRLAAGRKIFADLPVRQLRHQDTQYDRQLVERDKLAANGCRGDFGYIDRRDVRGDTDAESSDDAIDDKPGETIHRPGPDGRSHKEERGGNQHLLSPVTIAPGPRKQGSCQAADQRAAHRPAAEGRRTFQVEKGFIKYLGASDHHPVVTEQQSAHCRDEADQ